MQCCSICFVQSFYCQTEMTATAKCTLFINCGFKLCFDLQAVFLLNLRYVLPAQELSERVNYALASSGAAAVTAFAVALKVV